MGGGGWFMRSRTSGGVAQVVPDGLCRFNSSCISQQKERSRGHALHQGRSESPRTRPPVLGISTIALTSSPGVLGLSCHSDGSFPVCPPASCHPQTLGDLPYSLASGCLCLCSHCNVLWD